MTFAEFHNALRILTSVDRHELADVFTDGAAWHAFRTDPFRFFIRADDDTAQAIWRVIERRMGRTAPGVDTVRAQMELDR